MTGEYFNEFLTLSHESLLSSSRNSIGVIVVLRSGYIPIELRNMPSIWKSLPGQDDGPGEDSRRMEEIEDTKTGALCQWQNQRLSQEIIYEEGNNGKISLEQGINQRKYEKQLNLFYHSLGERISTSVHGTSLDLNSWVLWFWSIPIRTKAWHGWSCCGTTSVDRGMLWNMVNKSWSSLWLSQDYLLDYPILGWLE